MIEDIIIACMIVIPIIIITFIIRTIIQCLYPDAISFYEYLNRLIALRNQEQQLEYIYELYFHKKEVDVGRIKEIFQWLDDVNDRNEFILLNIRNHNCQDLSLFYHELTAIEENLQNIQNCQQTGIFLCLGDYNDQVNQEIAIQNDVNNQMDYNQMINQSNKLKVYEKIKSYAMKRFKIDNIQNVQKSHLNTIFGRQIFKQDLNQPLTFNDFYSKQYNIMNLGNIILTNNIKPKDISKMEDGESIVKEILRVEGLMKQQFKLNPKHVNGAAKKMLNRQIIIQSIENQLNLTKNVLQKIRNLQIQQPLNQQNIQADILSQILQIKEIALQYQWQDGVANIQDILNGQLNSNLLNMSIKKIRLKIYEKLWIQYNLPPINSDLESWIQLFKDIKIQWKFLQILKKQKLTVHKKEFIDVLQQIL